MHFSVSCGLSMCVMVLLFLPAQGQLQCAKPKPPNLGVVYPCCCMDVSKARIRETVDACFVQKEATFAHCKVDAYIFVTVSKKQLCVDPSAGWLPGRLRRLEERGIFCKNM